MDPLSPQEKQNIFVECTLDHFSMMTIHGDLMFSLCIILKSKIVVNKKEHKFVRLLVQQTTKIKIEIYLCENKVIHM